jgi:hypothetical protein
VGGFDKLNHRDKLCPTKALKPHGPMKPSERNKKWLKRLGWGGFLFFLVKGLIWLVVFFGLWEWLSN